MVDVTGNGLPRFRTSTGIMTTEKDWDNSKSRIRGSDMQTHLDNKKLSDIENKVTDLPIDYAKGGLTAEVVKLELQKVIAPHRVKTEEAAAETKPEVNNLLDAIQYYIQVHLQNGKRGTINAHKTYYQRVEEYAKKNSKKSVLLDNINEAFGDSFKELLFKKNYERSFVDKLIKYVKETMKYANYKMHWTNNVEFEKIKRIPRAKIKTTKVYLPEAEIELLRNVKVMERLKVSKDRLLFMCWVGLRFGDLKTITQEHRVGCWLKNFQMEKGVEITEPVDVWLRPEAQNILDKYNGEFPKISNKTMNADIKDICSLIPALCKLVKITSHKGDVTRVAMVKKYTKIGSHTGRRSFATNAILKGIPQDIVMRNTGHKDPKTFKEYICTTSDEMNIIAQREFERVYAAA